MFIRTRMGVSVDGFIATPDELPAFVAIPDFTAHGSYDWPAFSQQIEAVVMGRTGLDAGLGSGDWPWPGKQIYVLTSRLMSAAIRVELCVVIEARHAGQDVVDRFLRDAKRDGEHAISGNSGAVEYLVSADPAPYDIRLAFPDLVTEVGR